MYRASADTSGDESEAIKACKICLTTEGKLLRISGEERDAYTNLTGVEWNTSGRLPQHICVECGARLRGTMCLRRKALASRKLLDKILTLEASVTSSHIHLADRARRKLQSNLRTMHFTPIAYLAGVPTQCDKQTSTNDDDFLETPGMDPIENVECVIISDDSDTNGSSNFENEETRPANDAYDTGCSEIVAVDAVTQTEDYDSDSSEGKRLVIDVEEPMPTVLSSEYVGDSRGGMPVDELIDVYNNDEDGDARLQELSEHFGGECTIRIDLGWGARRDAGDRLRVRAARDEPVPGPAPRGGEPSKNSAKHFNMTQAYEKLNPNLFTFTQESELDQIAEINKRQYTLEFREAALKCFVCVRSFPNSLSYEAHMVRHNPVCGAFECNICKLRHKTASNLKKHVENYHTVKIVCNACDFVTMSRCGARNHEKVHEGTLFKCEHCPSHFKKEATYKNHVRRRHMKASICALCGFPFAGDMGLAVHRGRMHPDADQVPLLGPYCALCDVVFASLNAYTNHLSLASPHAPGFSEAPSMLPRGSEFNETRE